MKVSPVLIAGAITFFLGCIIFGAQLFRNGGLAKSQQFRVIGELLRGAHGGAARALVLLSLLLIPIGSCMLFAGVASSDGERRRRCEERCVTEGYARGRIGPNSDREPHDQSTWFVACICEGGEGEGLEIDANSLLDERSP